MRPLASRNTSPSVALVIPRRAADGFPPRRCCESGTLLRDLDRRVEVRHVDQIEPAELLAAFGKRPIVERLFARRSANRRGGRRILQARAAEARRTELAAVRDVLRAALARQPGYRDPARRSARPRRSVTCIAWKGSRNVTSKS